MSAIEVLLGYQSFVVDVAIAVGTFGAAIVALKIARDGRRDARTAQALSEAKADLLALLECDRALDCAGRVSSDLEPSGVPIALGHNARATEFARLARAGARGQEVAGVTSWVLILILEQQGHLRVDDLPHGQKSVSPQARTALATLQSDLQAKHAEVRALRLSVSDAVGKMEREAMSV